MRAEPRRVDGVRFDEICVMAICSRKCSIATGRKPKSKCHSVLDRDSGGRENAAIQKWTMGACGQAAFVTTVSDSRKTLGSVAWFSPLKSSFAALSLTPLADPSGVRCLMCLGLTTEQKHYQQKSAKASSSFLAAWPGCIQAAGPASPSSVGSG